MKDIKHVFPNDGEKHVFEDLKCWCGPVLAEKDEDGAHGPVVVHRPPQHLKNEREE